jgi:2-methylcitrate dehydratase PrpD
MTDQSGITSTLARFVVKACWNDIPECVRHEAKRSILNFIGTALAGCREEPIEITLASLA